MLWVALHLPSLSLESFAATLAAGRSGQPAEPAVALIDAHRIAAANAAARALGVKPGLRRATALALAPGIVLGQADAARDAMALVPVAHAALAFTPSVSLQPSSQPGTAPNTVLLEVEASLRYFGGLEPLLQRLSNAVQPLGHSTRIATAATAQAAAVLSRVDAPPLCTDLIATRHALGSVPVWLFGPGREHWEALQGMGLRTLSDLLGLPRAGLARRFGEAFLAEIDAALGQRLDPREPITLAPVFASRLELFARADSSEQVLYGASVLLERLIAWLAAQHAFVRRFRLVMHHEARWLASREKAGTSKETTLEIALADPARDSAHLLVLLRERLAQVQLPAPTLELALHAEDIAKRPPPNHELFPSRQSESEGLTRLIERLQARLGAEQVQSLAALEDHRPERASSARPVDAARAGKAAKTVKPGARAEAKAGTKQPSEPGRIRPTKAAATAAAASRPVWLQAEPEPLLEQQSQPLLEGRPLRLLCGPERIEAGWWDDALAERDYFVAEAADGALVWIYRARLPLPHSGQTEHEGARGVWYLHGRFG